MPWHKWLFKFLVFWIGLGIIKSFLFPSVFASSIASVPTAPIAADLVPIYQAAGKAYGVDWRLLAAVGRVESSDGKNQIGVRLDGRHGTRLIKDTDNGAIDRDTKFDRAVGIMQCIPSTCKGYAIDPNENGFNPFEPNDSIFTGAHYLSVIGAGNSNSIESALHQYNCGETYCNASKKYADKIMQIAKSIG